MRKKGPRGVNIVCRQAGRAVRIDMESNDEGI